MKKKIISIILTSAMVFQHFVAAEVIRIRVRLMEMQQDRHLLMIKLCFQYR